MKKPYKETAVAMIPKAELVYLNRNGDGPEYTDFIIKQLSAQLAERIMTVLSNEGEVIARLSDLRVEEYMPTNSVEYRRQITWSSLVRCKDCKHRDGEDGQCPLQTTGDPYLDTYPQNNFYCADGERREDYAEVH